MDFAVSEKMKAIIEMIDEFVDRELIPIEPEFMTKEFRDMLPVLEEKREMVKKMELWAPGFPKEIGGIHHQVPDPAELVQRLDRHHRAVQIQDPGQAGQAFPAVDAAGAGSAGTVVAGVAEHQGSILAAEPLQHV